MMFISDIQHESNKMERNFLLEKCTLCSNEMFLTEGSVIFGSDWYHKECFTKIEKKLNIKHGDELK